MPAWGNCNVFEKCLSSSQALTLRKTSKFGSPRSNSAIIFKCLSSTQALTLRKTSKIGSPRSNSAINFKCLSSTGTHFAQNLEIRLHPGQPSSGSPVQSSPAQFSPVQPSPAQSTASPRMSFSQPASQPAAESRNSTWSQVVATSEWRVRQARSQASHLFKDSKFLQSDCEVQLRKISRPAPSPRRTKRAPPTSSPSPKATGYESAILFGSNDSEHR